ncbi:MAG: ATP phosphoribosyltransferase regulatory subunit [Selenomonadaceae bacterium]|nr:ATP phosphoribosyltransferase regulatory subunit [Selenomonadaceae bacterium]
MEKDKVVLEIPYGTRDFLPDEAAGKRVIENQMAELFAKWGYHEVVTPTIEYLDTLTMGNGRSLEPHMFKFFDKNNRTVALRHEMTTPIARLVASRLKEAPMPLKLSYISNVYRYEQTQTGRQCEFYQAGVELMGSSSASADAEVIALAIRGLLCSGLKDFKICLGQVEFVNGVMEQYQLPDGKREKIRRSIEERNLVGLETLVDSLDLPLNAKDILKRIPLLHGDGSMLKEAYGIALNAQSRRALDNLSEIFALLECYGVGQYVTFDLGIIRDFNYYTGMVFEAYTPGLGFPLCGGGRYDHMLSDFGNACPATGFAIGIERILLALERQGIGKPEFPKDVFVAYHEGKTAEAVTKATELREAGKMVELALSAQTEAEAKRCQKEMGCKELVYLA